MAKRPEHGAAVHAGAAPVPEVSRRVRLHEVRDRPARLELKAAPDELEALRRRFELEALGSLRADVVLERLDGEDVYRLEGDLRADVTQLCVVTLEPVETVVEGSFAMTFVEGADGIGAGAGAEDTDLGEALDEDPPEPFFGDEIDVGEAVVQQFATMLDPYPRLPDATVDPALSGEETAGTASPFAVLADLASRGKRGAE